MSALTLGMIVVEWWMERGREAGPGLHRPDLGLIWEMECHHLALLVFVFIQMGSMSSSLGQKVHF